MNVGDSIDRWNRIRFDHNTPATQAGLDDSSKSLGRGGLPTAVAPLGRPIRIPWFAVIYTRCLPRSLYDVSHNASITSHPVVSILSEFLE